MVHARNSQTKQTVESRCSTIYSAEVKKNTDRPLLKKLVTSDSELVEHTRTIHCSCRRQTTRGRLIFQSDDDSFHRLFLVKIGWYILHAFCSKMRELVVPSFKNHLWFISRIDNLQSHPYLISDRSFPLILAKTP